MADKAVRYRVIGDASSLQRAGKASEQSLGGIEAAAGQLKSRASDTFSAVSAALSRTPGASGLTSTFSEIGGALDGITSKLTNFGNLTRTQQLGAGLLAGGAALVGIGALLTRATFEQREATAGLEQALNNANTSLAEHQEQVDRTASRLMRLGFADETTYNAIAKLTIASQDADRAIDLMGLAADLARVKKIDLTGAADLLSSALAGNFRWARSLGIVMPDVAKAERDAESAEKALASASEHLATARQRLADWEERAAEQRSEAQKRLTHDAEEAESRITDARERAADVAVRIAERIRDSQERAGEAVRHTYQQMMDAAERLADVQSELDEKTKTSRDDERELQDAHRDVARARADLANATGDNTDELERYREAQERVAQIEERQAERHTITTADQRRLRDANRAVEESTNAYNVALEEQGQASAVTRSEQSQLKDANDAVAKAQQNAADVAERQLEIGRLSVSQQQEHRNLVKAIADAEAEVAKAADDRGKAVAAANELGDKTSRFFAELERRIGGTAEKLSETLPGKLRFLGIQFDELIEKMGAWGPLISIAGTAFTLLGAVLTGVQLVGLGTAAWIGAIGLALVGLAAAGYLLYKNWDEVWGWISDRLSSAKDWITDNLDLVAAAVLLPIAPLILLVTHWDEAWSFMAGAPAEAFGFMQQAVSAGLVWLWDRITGIPGMFVRGLGDAGEWLVGVGWNAIVGFWNGLVKAWDVVYDLILDLFQNSFIGKVLDWLGVMSPSTVFADIGRNTMLGLAMGIRDQGGAALDEVRAVTDAMRNTQVDLGEVTAAVRPSRGGRDAGGINGREARTEVHWHGDVVVQGSAVTERKLVDAVHSGFIKKLRDGGDLALARPSR